MKLIDRYLFSIGENLPAAQRDDILQELRSNILDEAEQQQESLGRELHMEEEEALLRKFGHPIVVGMRYLPKQYLIGPALFPYYAYALKTVLPAGALIYILVNAILVALQPIDAQRLVSMFFGVSLLLFTLASWVTLVFAILEHAQTRQLFLDWSPRKLPEIPEKPTHSKRSSSFEIALGGAALIWFLLVPRYPFLMFGAAASQIAKVQFAPEWQTAYWAFILIMLAQWACDIVAFFHPAFRTVRGWIGMVGRVGVASIFWLLSRVPSLVSVNEPGRVDPNWQHLATQLDPGLHYGLRIVAAIILLQIAWQIVEKFLRRSAGNAVGMIGTFDRD